VSHNRSYTRSCQALFTKVSLLAAASCSASVFWNESVRTLLGSWKRLIEPLRGRPSSAPTAESSIDLDDSVRDSPPEFTLSTLVAWSPCVSLDSCLVSLSAASSCATFCSSRCVYDKVGFLQMISTTIHVTGLSIVNLQFIHAVFTTNFASITYRMCGVTLHLWLMLAL
jgi:hypothetical protein